MKPPAVILLLASILSPASLSAPSVQTTRRISVSSSGAEGNNHSSRGAPGQGGRIVFISDASNLVPGDTNGISDVFLHDTATAKTEIVSVGPAGEPGDGPSRRPVATPDGRFIAFQSSSTNLVAGGTPAVDLVYVRDRLAGTTQLASLSSTGALPNVTSSFVFLDISADSRFVTFSSPATNLVSGDLNQIDDIFVRDRDPDGDGVFDPSSATTVRVTVNTNGVEADRGGFFPVITHDGRYVSFHTNAMNLAAGATGAWDVYVHDRDPDENGTFDESNGVTRRVSRPAGASRSGNSRDGHLSADGRHLVFWSEVSNLVTGDRNGVGDVFVANLRQGGLVRVSVSSSGQEGNRESDAPGVSRDGRFVSFRSTSSNLVPGDTNGRRDMFMHDRDPDGNGIMDEGNGRTTRQNVDVLGRAPTRPSDFPSLSDDGRWFVFETISGTLVPDDANLRRDVFLRDLVSLEVRPGVDQQTPGELHLSRAFGDEGHLALALITRRGVDFLGTSFSGSPPIPLILDPMGLALARGPHLKTVIDPSARAVIPLPRTPPGIPLSAAVLILDRRGRATTVTSPVSWIPGAVHTVEEKRPNSYIR